MDPLQPHTHEPNPAPPSADPAFRLMIPNGSSWLLTPADLATMPQTVIPGCYIVSTGHGTSGPFTFRGVALKELIAAYYDGSWADAEIVSADEFGTRIFLEEVLNADPVRPMLLATHIDGRPMTREEGLVRLIVPGEVDDALRQVKWVGGLTINI